MSSNFLRDAGPSGGGLGRALEIGGITAIDATSGMVISSFVELFAPPIRDQSPIQMGIEGLIQLLTIVFLGIEGSKLIHRLDNDPTHGLPYAIGMLAGMPNTMAKLTMTAGYVRGVAKGIIYKQPTEGAPPPPVTTKQEAPTPSS